MYVLRTPYMLRTRLHIPTPRLNGQRVSAQLLLSATRSRRPHASHWDQAHLRNDQTRLPSTNLEICGPAVDVGDYEVVVSPIRGATLIGWRIRRIALLHLPATQTRRGPKCLARRQGLAVLPEQGREVRRGMQGVREILYVHTYVVHSTSIRRT